MAEAIERSDLPRRDQTELRRTVRLPGLDPTPVPAIPIVTPRIDQVETFWVADLDKDVHFTVDARLRVATDHAYFYTQESVPINDRDLDRAARAFEDKVYPSVARYFAPNRPATPPGQRLTILLGRVPGVGGYFSSSDLLTRDVNPFSNERFMIYINSGAVPPGNSGFDSVIAHEYSHAVSALNNYNPATWLNEGSAELSSNLAGFTSGSAGPFLTMPETQLNAWARTGATVGAHYGGAFLFLKYLYQQYGGFAGIPDLLGNPGRGTYAVDRYLRERHGTTFDAVFDDWIVANLVDSPADRRFEYPNDDIKIAVNRTLGPGGRTSEKIDTPPYAARYVRLRDPARIESVSIAGTDRIRELDNDAHGGRIQWWSNRGDLIESTLTRAFDLTGTSSARLEFWAWYDIEPNWDYAYLMASTDEGATWQLLSASTMSRENPTGNNLGVGWTGNSGGGQRPAWVRETVDLSAYAGRRILLRFAYVTDEGFEGPGFAVDDLSLPEIGFQDDAESGSGWDARGFLPLLNELPTRLTARLVQTAPRLAVVDVPIGPDGTGRVRPADVLPDAQDLYLVVAGHAPATTVSAPVTITVQPRG